MMLKTERLILREFTIEDLDAFAHLMADPEVMRFSLNGPMRDKERVREYLHKRILDHYLQHGYGLYAVIAKADQTLLGLVGLINQTIDGENKTELAYRLHPRYWGQGLATEACQTACQHAFSRLGIQELISIIDPANIRSLKVAERMGMSCWKETLFHGVPVKIFALKNGIVRNLQDADINELVQTFTFPWSSPEATLKLWRQWFREQQEGVRTVCVIEASGRLVGYGSLLRSSEYSYFREKGIPDVHAIWVDEPCRRQGLGKKLIGHLENMALQEGYKAIGIGVGLYKDYGPAQRLYVKMGYQPDGNGITYKSSWVVPGTPYPVDDELLIWLSKPLVGT